MDTGHRGAEWAVPPTTAPHHGAFRRNAVRRVVRTARKPDLLGRQAALGETKRRVPTRGPGGRPPVGALQQHHRRGTTRRGATGLPFRPGSGRLGALTGGGTRGQRCAGRVLPRLLLVLSVQDVPL